MANVIATVISDTKNIDKTADARGPSRHAYDELVDLQSSPSGDPELASPYLKASAQSTVAATGGSSGNFTITMNFPKYGVAVTTANIVYNAAEAAIQTAIDNALSGETVVSSYNAGDVDAAVTGNVSANAATITANGSTVNGAHMIVTTTNVDLDVAAPAVTQVTAGTMNRPAEALLALFDVVSPSGTVPYQGQAATESDYSLGDNPFSISPGLQKLLIDDIILNEDDTIGVAIREAVGCVGPNS